jgi:hypothetical protein
MGKLKISSTIPNNLVIPPSGFITIFADANDTNKPKYIDSDGNIISLVSSGTGGTGTQLLDSVKDIIVDPDTITPNVGDKFLVGVNGVNGFSGKDGQIAERGLSFWTFTQPINSTILAVDTYVNSLYIYKGSYPTGDWNRLKFLNSVLGLPTDGSWSDGLFDFELDTTVDALDKINEFLTGLVPQSPPILEDWSENGLPIKQTGKLSFDTSNPISGYNPVDGVNVDEAFNIGGKRLGITDKTTGNVSGILNPHVIVSDTGNYPANTFLDADKGVLQLLVNDIIIGTVDLESSTGVIDGTSNGTLSGINASAQESVKFPSGVDFNFYQIRSGSWLVLKSDLINGYNTIELKHIIGTDEITLDQFDLVIDDNTDATILSSPSLHTLSMTGSKKLTGVDYHTGGSALYDLLIDNAYKNTYSSDIDAISHQGLYCSAPSQPLGDCLGDENLQISISDKVVQIDDNLRILNGGINIQTTVKRTVQTQVQGGFDSISGILLDSIPNNNTTLFENFVGEIYRLPNNIDFDNPSDVDINLWDSEMSLDGNVGYDDGLQMYNGLLVYPTINFSTANIPNGSTFNDGGVKGGVRDYSSLLGIRTFYRMFRQTSPTTANFILNISGYNLVFVPKSVGLTGNNAHLEMKIPGETGWLDCYEDFVTNNFSDGDGARNATNGVGRLLDTDWGLTIGTKNTANSQGKIVLKISVGSNFVGGFNNINVNFL